MIDLKLVQKDPQILADALKNRHSSINIEEFRELDQKRRSILAEVEALKSERNQASAKIAAMKKEGRQEEAQGLFADLGRLSDRTKAKMSRLTVGEQFQNFPSSPAIMPILARPWAAWILNGPPGWPAAVLSWNSPGRPGLTAPWPVFFSTDTARKAMWRSPPPIWSTARP